MLTLAAADTLAADASVGAIVTCTVMGMELAAGGTETYKVLDQRQLSSSPATIYTVPGSTTTFIRTILLVNTDVASQTFQLFRGGTAASNAITPVFTIGAGGSAVYEDGTGWQFYSASGLVTSPTPAMLNDIHTGYSEYQAVTAPSAPASGVVRLSARTLSGRTLPKWTPPSGIDQATQPQLWGNHTMTYYPSSSTNGGTATLGGFGQSWTAGGTVSHPTPASGSLFNALFRTRYANVVTTTNQTLGLTSIGAGVGLNWFRGDGGGRGGFFFVARYSVDLWAAATCRIFVGLQSSATAQVTLDIASMTGDFAAFAHDVTDSGTQMWFITRDNTTTNKVSITVPTIAAGNVYDFYIYCKPGDSTIFFRMDDLVNNTTIVDSSTASNLPRTTIFMGPAITMSNGTANVTATTVAPGIAKAYIDSDT